MKGDIFQAIGDPTRRAILTLLAVQIMTPNAIAEHFDSSRQAVSKHIKVLTDCDLLRSKQDGREIHYRLNPSRMKEIDKWLDQFRRLWETRFDQLDEILNNKKKKSNEK
jgi:DNA-binding transcriptional ArsR family regulator